MVASGAERVLRWGPRTGWQKTGWYNVGWGGYGALSNLWGNQ